LAATAPEQVVAIPLEATGVVFVYAVVHVGAVENTAAVWLFTKPEYDGVTVGVLSP
jgi:hypothetical protein